MELTSVRLLPSWLAWPQCTEHHEGQDGLEHVGVGWAQAGEGGEPVEGGVAILDAAGAARLVVVRRRRRCAWAMELSACGENDERMAGGSMSNECSQNNLLLFSMWRRKEPRVFPG